MPKVSVVIPIYNVEEYIERCARSLFEQTLDDIEYLFIDDCSPDNSVSILKSVLLDYPQRAPYVHIHRMDHNSGQAKVREWGCKNANGEYIIHCDTDDWVEKNMYERMYNKAKAEDLDLVMCNFVVTDGHSLHRASNLDKYCNITKDTFFRGLLADEIHRSTWNKLIRRSVFDNDIVYPIYNMWEDVVIIIQLTFYCKKIGFIAECFYNYYLNPNSITMQRDTSSMAKKLMQVKGNVSIILEFLKKHIKNDDYKTELLLLKFGVLTYAKPLGPKIYRSVYPKQNVLFLLCGRIPVIERLGHLARLLGLR